MDDVRPDSAQTCGLLEQVRQGDRQALERLLEHYRPDLRAFVDLHLDARVRARVDASDVVQDAQLEAAQRIEDFLRRRPMPFRLWLYKTAYERLLDMHRYHRRARRRSVDREVALPERSSLLLAGPLLAGGPTPSQQAQGHELAERVSRAVAGLPDADREVLLMRHAEGLPFGEIGCLLGIEPAAARKRFGRALIRLQRALTDHGLLR